MVSRPPRNERLAGSAISGPGQAASRTRLSSLRAANSAGSISALISGYAA